MCLVLEVIRDQLKGKQREKTLCILYFIYLFIRRVSRERKKEEKSQTKSRFAQVCVDAFFQHFAIFSSIDVNIKCLGKCRLVEIVVDLVSLDRCYVKLTFATVNFSNAMIIIKLKKRRRKNTKIKKKKYTTSNDDE